MRKFIYCLLIALLFFPISVIAATTNAKKSSIEISYINVTLNGANINSGVVSVEPGQQLQLRVLFNYYGGQITDYNATRLRLDDGQANGKIQALANHFEKITDNQAGEDVTITIAPTVKSGATIPVKFIIDGPDVSSEEDETITFVIKNATSGTTDSSSSNESSSSESSNDSSSSSESSTDSSSSSESSSSESSNDSSSSSESSSTESSNDSSSSSESSSTESSNDSSSSSESSSTESSNDSSSSSESSSTESSNDSSSSSESSSTESSNDSSSIEASDSMDSNQKDHSKTDHSASNNDLNEKKQLYAKNKLVPKNKNNSTSGVQKKATLKFLPKTGMKTSGYAWVGLGLTNLVVALYLFRKK
ncbi:LPXTG cell wall anchor domain-containing protein [Enterococcus sp. 22-H-5-01]|uniref:LPXTG cell wall anchor domain-containing protein n=1 Tax=Enterococcus sp. 22-H-5-01 TaxID=3418555 RepID=UPI003D06CB57